MAPSQKSFHPLSWQVLLSGIVIMILGSLALPYFQNPDILFQENFNDKKAQKLVNPNPAWRIITDETDQEVFELDNTKGTGYPDFTIGNAEWTDFTISFRLRIFEKDGIVLILHFRENEEHKHGYVLGLQGDLGWVTLAYKAFNSEWVPLNVEQFNYDRNVWYNVRVAADGSKLSVYIDDFLVGQVQDERIRAGRFSVSAGPGTFIQIDDIVVEKVK